MTTIKPQNFVNVAKFITLMPPRSEAEQDADVIQKVEQRGRFFRVTLDDGSGRPTAQHWWQGWKVREDTEQREPYLEKVGDWAHPLFTEKLARKLRWHDEAEARVAMFDNGVRVPPYEYVQYDVDVKDGYRLILYGAYNAMGLIGSEHNGIALLDNKRREVIADRVVEESSGWGGASIRQLRMAHKLARLMIEDRQGFAAVMNKLCAGRLRREVVA